MTELFLENITEEIRGHIYPGKLRLKPTDLMFRNEITGKVAHFSSGDISSANWVFRASGLCLRLKLNNENVHRYDGFGEIESEKVTSFFKKNYGVDIAKRELCYKGFNWGDVVFEGNVMEFAYKNALIFDVPLSNISNAAANKNEVIFEFHPNDDAEICLSEMRFHTPSTESDKDGAATAIYSHVMQKADIIQVTGDSLVEFKDISYLQPRGRYDVKLYNSFLHLHGKSFDYKIPKSTIIRLLLLPHPDNRQVFFAAQVDPPLKHGQTRYHIIVMVFEKDKHIDIELSVSEEYLQKNYEGKLTQVMVGPEYDLFARLCKTLYNQKITVPGSFRAKGGGSAVACSYKTYVGLLYPLERGFIFVPRPPVSIRFDEIVSVNFSRGTGALRSFDFEVETKMGVTHTFVSIERDEYHKLYDYVSEKRLRVKNIEDSDAVWREKLEDIWSSSDESHDAYLDKVKAEGRERTAEAAAGTFAGADFSDDDEDDEDFNPPEMGSSESDIAEEYDSNAQSSSDSDSSSAAGSTSASSASSSSASTPRQKKAKRVAPPPRQSDKKERKKASKKDPNAPSRPPTAYFIWFNEHRQDIKMSLGGSVGVAEVAKAAGEKWKTLSAEEKAKYQSEADKLKEQYDRDMRAYKEKIASGELEEPVKSSVKKTKISPTKMQKKAVTAGTSSSQSGAGGIFKSAEYVSDSESSSSSVSSTGRASRRGDGGGGSGSMTDLSD
uniref:FACT complex subunit SSRP1 n=1 Tax=Echinococcus granulosus TaxID=6210 RepID=A0A068W913_ECHGR|nr:fact complex subunit ssrp1 [Echinococcus granulosus]